MIDQITAVNNFLGSILPLLILFLVWRLFREVSDRFDSHFKMIHRDGGHILNLQSKVLGLRRIVYYLALMEHGDMNSSQRMARFFLKGEVMPEKWETYFDAKKETLETIDKMIEELRNDLIKDEEKAQK